MLTKNPPIFSVRFWRKAEGFEKVPDQKAPWAAARILNKKKAVLSKKFGTHRHTVY